jgi:hypothetical protein
MKWKIRIELTPDGNDPITYNIGTITRPMADLLPEQIGLTLEEGQQLLPRVQSEMISSQAHAYALRSVPPPKKHSCGSRSISSTSTARSRRCERLIRLPFERRPLPKQPPLTRRLPYLRPITPMLSKIVSSEKCPCL